MNSSMWLEHTVVIWGMMGEKDLEHQDKESRHYLCNIIEEKA